MRKQVIRFLVCQRTIVVSAHAEESMAEYRGRAETYTVKKCRQIGGKMVPHKADPMFMGSGVPDRDCRSKGRILDLSCDGDGNCFLGTKRLK
jgi:hypothetical protein